MRPPIAKRRLVQMRARVWRGVLLGGLSAGVICAAAPIRGHHGDSVLACGSLIHYEPVSYGFGPGMTHRVADCPDEDFQQRRRTLAIGVPAAGAVGGTLAYAASKRRRQRED